jgi:thiol:disulfide interchange protein
MECHHDDNFKIKRIYQSDKDRRKAEVRAKLEQEAAAKKGKKKGGFMTPERKRKLRNLLRKKAAEEMKIEKARKEAEKKKIIEERIGSNKKDVTNANEGMFTHITFPYSIMHFTHQNIIN